MQWVSEELAEAIRSAWDQYVEMLPVEMVPAAIGGTFAAVIAKKAKENG
jgi:hypothetical protein